MSRIDAPESLPLKDRIRNVSAEVIRDFHTNGTHPLENNTVYNFLQEGLSRTEKDAVLQRISKASQFNLIKRTLGEKFSVCLFHPGIRTRLKDFIDFCKGEKNEDESLTPSEALQKFSSHLGETTLYRGMALTHAESETIQQRGIMAPALRNNQEAINALSILLDPSTQKFDPHSPYPTSFSDDIWFRTRHVGGSNHSISISTSDSSTIANSVGWHESRKKDIPGVLPYLYTLRVPRLLTYDERQLVGDTRGFETIIVGDQTFEGSPFEIFIPFGVGSKNISSIEQTPIPPDWKGTFNIL